MNHWPKVEYFLWILSHKKISTWDNLQKRGMYGPSVCSLCRKSNETIEHILNSCAFVEPLWRRMEIIFKQSDQDPSSITSTILNWRKGGYKCGVINRAWKLALGFLAWDI